MVDLGAARSCRRRAEVEWPFPFPPEHAVRVHRVLPAPPERVPGQRLRCTGRFDDPQLPGLMQVTVTLAAGVEA